MRQSTAPASIALALDKLSLKSTKSGAIQAERQPFFSGFELQSYLLASLATVVFLIFVALIIAGGEYDLSFSQTLDRGEGARHRRICRDARTDPCPRSRHDPAGGVECQ